MVDISSLNDWQELDEKGNVKFFHKKGSSFIFAPQANARFGNRGHNVTGGGYIVHDFSYDKVSQSELFNRSHIYLKEHSVPAINYEVDGRTGAKIGDTVKIVDDGYTPPLILSARVLEQVGSFDNASVEQATLGNYKALQSQISDDIQERLNEFPYTIKLSTDNGVVFKNNVGQSIVTPRLYKGSEQVVMNVTWRWALNGNTTTGMTYTVLGSNVADTATLTVTAYIGNDMVAVDEISFVNVSDGQTGQTVWKAYANSADGMIDFSITDANRRYEGQYTGINQSTNPADYTWIDKGAGLLNVFYPIGAIYQSTNATSPEALMGGTWEVYDNSQDPTVYRWRRIA